MDYGGLVRKSLDIMWKFKYLWIFGFFLEFGSGGGTWFGNLPDRVKLPVSHYVRGDVLGGALVGAVLLLIALALLIFVIFLIMYFISQGGMVHCVWKIQSGENAGLREGWDAGIKYFWRIVGISLLILVIILAAGILTLGPFILGIIAFKALGLLLGVVLFPIFLLVLVTLLLIDLYATRACVIEDKGVFDSIAAGWDMLKNNLGPSLVVALISIGSTMAYTMGFVIVGLLLAAPFVAIAAFDLLLGIFAGVLVGLIYIGILSAMWGTYIDSLWTLAYLEMKKPKLQPVPVQST
jgi:hypothetical protein